MSYYGYDKNGYVGDVASIGGWEDLVRALPPVAAFAQTGTTDDPQALRAALINTRLQQQDVEDTRVNLVKLLMLSEGSFTVSEGEET